MKKHPRIRLSIEPLESRLLPSSGLTFNVDNYGALGNGQADDTVTIRDAISAAEAAGGGTVYFPAGTYLVAPQASDPVTDEQPIFQITGSNLTFEGAGAGESIIDGRCIGLTDPATNWRVTGENYFKISRFGLFNITTNAATGPVSNVTFEGLTMDGGAGYTGDSDVGGDPTTGDGWDLSHKAILLNGSEPINNVSVLSCTLCDWRGEIVYAGGNEIGKVSLTNDNIYGTNASAISVSGNLIMTNVMVGGTAPGMECYNGVEDYAVTSSQGTNAQNCTFESCGNGIVYIGVSGAKLVVNDSNFLDNHNGILLSSLAYNVTVSDSLFQGNANAVETTLLGSPEGFGNFSFIDNTYNDTGAAFLSQNYAATESINGLLFSGNTLTNSVLLQGGFNGPTWTNFVVKGTILGTGASDVNSYDGTNFATWSGTVRPSNPSIYSYGDRANGVSGQTTTDFTPISDYTILNNNSSTGTQTATLTPSVIGKYPVGFTTTIFAGKLNWVLPVNSAWNTFTSPVAVPAAGVTLVVGANGKFTLAWPISSTKSTATLGASTVVSEHSDTVTIALTDANGNPISGIPSSYFGLKLSGGTSSGTFSPVTETATKGTYTAVFTGVGSGTASNLTVVINGVTLSAKPAITVNPGPIYAGLSKVTLAQATNVSGTTDTVMIVVKDAIGNAVTGLASSAFHLSLTGGTSTGTFGTVAATTTLGTYKVLFTGATAGTASTLNVSVNGVTLTSVPTVTVTAGAVSGVHSTVNFAAPTVVPGNTDTVTIVVKDAAGNVITGLASSAFMFILSGGTSSGTFGAVTETGTKGTYTVVFTGTTVGTATTLTLEIDSVTLQTKPAITV